MGRTTFDELYEGDSPVASQGSLPAGSFFTNGFTRLSPAMKKVTSRTGRARIAFLGNSLTAGWGAGTQVGNTGGLTPGVPPTGMLRSASVVSQLKTALVGLGIPTRSDAAFITRTNANTAAEQASYNPNLSFAGSTWSVTALSNMYYATAPNTSTDALTFKPEITADTFDVYYLTGSGNGQFSVTDASGTLGTADSNAASGMSKLTVRRDGISRVPVSIQRTGGGAIFIYGIVPSNSELPALELWNIGIGGATAARWNQSDTAFAAANVTPVLAPDAFVIELGVNDSNTGVAVATFQTDLQAIATRAATTSDVIMVKPNKAPLGNPFNLSAAYLTAIEVVAGSNLIIDFNTLSAGFVTADYYDAVHPSGQGYGKEAGYAAPLLAGRF